MEDYNQVSSYILSLSLEGGGVKGPEAGCLTAAAALGPCFFRKPKPAP